MEFREFALYALEDSHNHLIQALDGLTDGDIMWQPTPVANHIAFILWHMFREEDRFFQYKLQGIPQVWETERWHERLGLPADPQDVGFGWTAEQVAAFPRVKLRDLLAYRQAVRARTLDFLRQADDAVFRAIVPSDVFGDTSAGNRIAHLIVELAEHVGQIGYLKGLINSASM